MKKIWFLIFFLSSPLILPWAKAQAISSDPAIRKADQLHLSADREWLRLLHFQRNIFGLWRSGIDDPAFFLSPRGQKDPEAELKATLTALYSSTSTDDGSIQCSYPARTAWLNEKLNFLSDLPQADCERYESWKEKMAPKSVALIFASYYFNNPASMYGHTFFKLNRQGYEEGKGLLDYTVNYAAQATTKNGVTFALKGLTGGYKGRFSTDPYYIKIQKYNNIESRDLWEYDLNLSSMAIERLVQHLWEVGPFPITYYFFNKNCSYQLLPMLEVADPRLNLSSRFKWRTIPLDTLQEVLKAPGLVSGWRLRPSHVRTMLKRRSLLSPEERELAKGLGLHPDSPRIPDLKRCPKDRQALVLDSAYDYLRYKVGFYRDRPEAAQEKEQSLLLLRKDLPLSTSTASEFINNDPPPQSAHRTGRTGLSIGANRKEGFEEVTIRAALHDQEADPTGYVPGSQLEMADVRARLYNRRSEISLEKFTLVEIFSLAPWDPWVHPPSWRVWTGLDVAHDLNKDPDDSLAYGVKGGSGFTFNLPYVPGGMWYGLWRSEGAAGHAFRDGYRAGLGGQTGLLLPVTNQFRIHFSADALRFPAGNVGNVVRFNGTANYTLTRDWELRLVGERQNSYQEVRLGLNYYW